MWTKREDCKAVIKATWEGCLQINTPNGIADGFKHYVADLSRWNKLVFGYVQDKYKTREGLSMI